MSFKPPFSIGEVVSNAVMTEAFKIGNMGGMRRSKTTGTLVLISDNTKGLYSDKWHDGILHYTGMGKVGNQTLDGNQNKTLAESETNGVEVHLFEVDDPGKYTYAGVVELAGKPYQETQPDDNGNSRKVWMFPLKKVSEENPVLGPRRKLDYEALSKQSMVFHNMYGTGIVTRITETNIYVAFGEQQRIFPYPKAFEKGWLTFGSEMEDING